ncbi:MAG TPA: hypothetical protein VMW18_12280 [Candidatus Binatia bacterium]|nr:hypothetical protein [Candidatus Binatia bacterium]
MSDALSESELRLWTTDEAGVRVLRGLTAEQTEWHQEFVEKELAQRLGVSKPWATPEAFEADRARWRELNRAHELARAEVIHSEDNKRIAEEEAKGKRGKRRY